ncbi:GNAT family N-acetyltransferase [Nocardioides sp. SYSU D00038]|uniref:GNAT family N-acetyltransferase n=1 Tax=Nocardioides sp. SYSU D00038 TaxID=2812554 RepID=UPI0019670E33|nr:GNAT family N-acetyltransferase [Nocardioides sp. SYSU D00038]
MLAEGYRVVPLTVEHVDALAAAYARNREHLAPWDPDRPDSFFTVDGQAEAVGAQLQATALGQAFSWVVEHGDLVVGRVTINNVVRAVLQSGNVGYWIDAEHTGRGLATAAVEHAAAGALAAGLHRLEAGTLVHNVASQGVLRRTGFERIGLARNFLFVAGQWRDHVLFQRILHDEAR